MPGFKNSHTLARFRVGIVDNKEYCREYMRKRRAALTPEGRRAHSITRRHYKRLRKLALLKLFGNACIDCGYNGHPAALDFDHRDPDTKTTGIAHATSWTKAVEEAEKCEIRCANCHRIKTYNTAYRPRKQ